MSKRITQGLNPDKLDQLIKDLGVRVKVWKSTVCPNMTSLESIDHDINCTKCNNNMIDFDPVETIALFQQQDMTEQFKVQGTFHIDKIFASFLSGVTLQTFTKVQLLDFQEDFFELVQRQEGDVDLLKYPACTVLGLFTLKDDVLTRYYFGTDFKLNNNGDILWIKDRRPDPKAIYTVYYQYHPIFRAIEAIHRDRYSQYNLRPEEIEAPSKTVNGSTYVKLPEAWILKRDYLLERRDKITKELLPPNQFADPNE